VSSRTTSATARRLEAFSPTDESPASLPASGCDLAALKRGVRVGSRYTTSHVCSVLSPDERPLSLSAARLDSRDRQPRALRSGDLGTREVDLGGRRERRGCLIAEVKMGETVVDFAVTHLSLHRATRAAQLAQLANASRRSVRSCSRATSLRGAELEVLSGVLTFPGEVPATYPSVRPFRALDHIGYSGTGPRSPRGAALARVRPPAACRGPAAHRAGIETRRPDPREGRALVACFEMSLARRAPPAPSWH